MGRHSCDAKQKLKKGLWSPEEDEKLYNHMTRFGVRCWSSVPKATGLLRCGKSCRLRWINYLRPDLKRGMFSEHEESQILSLHQRVGNRWAQIASQLPGRTDNEIKNFWNSFLKKKLIKQGINPITHTPFETRAIKGENLTDKELTQINSGYSDFVMKQPAFDPLMEYFEYNPGMDYLDCEIPKDGFSLENSLYGFSMPGDFFWDSSLSKTSSFIFSETNESSANSSNNGCLLNMVENESFCWDENPKLESIFQCDEFNGMKIEEMKPSSDGFGEHGYILGSL